MDTFYFHCVTRTHERVHAHTSVRMLNKCRNIKRTQETESWGYIRVMDLVLRGKQLFRGALCVSRQVPSLIISPLLQHLHLAE